MPTLLALRDIQDFIQNITRIIPNIHDETQTIPILQHNIVIKDV